MIRQKGFKSLVRARMAKTGERYAAARRAIDGTTGTSASGIASSHGNHPQTAALATLLAMRGARIGSSGRSFTEEEVLGIGGGLGSGYILWEFESHPEPFLTLGFLNRWQYPVAWLERALDRIGIRPQVVETAGPRKAAAALDELLDAGEPVIAWVDPEPLGTWGLQPVMSGYVGTQVVVTERRGDRYVIEDRGASLEIERSTMAAARGRIVSYKHRLVRVPAGSEVPDTTVRDAYRAGILDQVEHLRSTSASFGLPAWRKWSRMLIDRRDAKSWPLVFADRRGLFGSLLAIVDWVDGDVGPAGGHLRAHYAGFLDRAANVLDRPGLRVAADSWRAAADLWEDFADAVPKALPWATEAIEAAQELHEAVLAGDAGRARAREAERKVWAARERYAGDFPMPSADVDRLFEDLSDRLAAILAAEVAAVDSTARAIEG